MATERRFQTGALTLAQVRLIAEALEVARDSNEDDEVGQERTVNFNELAEMFGDDGAHLIPLDE